MKRLLQFRLRTALILMLVIAVYLAWRLHDQESQATFAIQEAGATTFAGYQYPWIGANSFISLYPMPGYDYFAQNDIAVSGGMKTPKLSLKEIIFGHSDLRKTHAVKLTIDQCTQDVVQNLHRLTQLDLLVVEMPKMALKKDSRAVRRLDEIREEFGDRVCPTAKLGF